MNNKKHLTLSIGVILLTVVIGMSIPQTGHGNAASMPPDKDVRVVNTAAERVPVDVAGAVQASQQGPWNVGVVGTVAVVNPTTGPLVVRDIDRPTAQPFNVNVDLVIPDGNQGENAFIPIPAGKLLVVEHISAFASVPLDQVMEQFSVLTRVNPDQINRFHYLNDEKRSFQFANTHTVSENVRLYCDAPSMTVRATRLTANGNVTVRYAVSGYLVNK